MLISDLSYLVSAETTVVGSSGYIFPIFVDKSKTIVVKQAALAKGEGSAFFGSVYVGTSASNSSYISA